MRKLTLILLALLMATLPSSVFGEDGAQEAPEETKVDLYVFLWDRCGGCGVDAPGCGECRDTERYHLSIKEQLGDRMYDGTLTYRMLNCRYEEFRQQYAQFQESYGVQKEWHDLLPAVFIGRDGSGVYMTGEAAIADVGEVLAAYEVADDDEALQALQQEIFDRYAEREQAATESD